MKTLSQWLAWQERQHPQSIDLGLSRVRAVWQQMDCSLSSAVVIVAGTNGKGTAAYALDALARADGWSTGRYTSPHLYRYNERVCLNGNPVSDDELCRAFERVEAARGDTALTYFEYGTLAALAIFAEHGLDLCILEVGLGGRLDATNIIDADLSILCSLALDHQDWLGHSLADIAREKAGVCRAGRPAIVADADSFRYYEPVLQQLLAKPVLVGADFPMLDCRPSFLPAASLSAAKAAWQILRMEGRSTLADADAMTVLRELRIPGRTECRQTGFGEFVLDVAHNPAAAHRLKSEIQGMERMETALVVGMAADKDISATCAVFAGLGKQFFLCDLPEPRGAKAKVLVPFFSLGATQCFQSPAEALQSAELWAQARFDETGKPVRIIIAGSFLTVGACGLG